MGLLQPEQLQRLPATCSPWITLPLRITPPAAHQVGAKGSKLLGKRFDLDEDGDVSVADQLRDALVSNAVRNLLGPTDYGLFI